MSEDKGVLARGHWVASSRTAEFTTAICIPNPGCEQEIYPAVVLARAEYERLRRIAIADEVARRPVVQAKP